MGGQKSKSSRGDFRVPSSPLAFGTFPVPVSNFSYRAILVAIVSPNSFMPAFFLRGRQLGDGMGGGRNGCFWGAPILHLIVEKWFWLKIGAPPKMAVPTTTHPIPHLMPSDFQGVAKEVGKRSSITLFYFRSLFGHFFLARLSLFCHFSARLVLPDSFCGRMIFDVLHNYCSICCNMGYRKDVPV